MSDLYVNIRIGLYHIQIAWNWPFVRIHRNDAHVGYPEGRFAVYKFFGVLA